MTSEFKPDSTRTWNFTFQLLAPNDLSLLGELKTVVLSSVTINEGYYTDERMSCSLDYEGVDRINPRAWVRIIASSNDGFTYTLGTFIPKGESQRVENGVTITTLDLTSVLYGIQGEYRRGLCVLPKGGYAYDTLADLCSNVPFDAERTKRECNNCVYVSTTTCDIGNSELQNLFDVANQTINRVHVDVYGRIYLTKYIVPRDKDEYAYYLNPTDPACGIETSVSYETEYLEEFMNCVVYATSSDEDGTTLIGVAYKGDYATEKAKRGYVCTYSTTISDMQPFTQAEANQRAAKHLSMRDKYKQEWTFKCLWQPWMKEGQIVTWVAPTSNDNTEAGNRIKCFVKTVELNLETMQVNLTVRAASSGDESDEE